MSNKEFKITHNTKDVFVKTRDGRKAYISHVLPSFLALDMPVVGGVKNKDGAWGECSWDMRGLYSNRASAHDIIDWFEPEKEIEEPLTNEEIKKIRRLLEGSF